jgi:hypothetical protein
MNLRYKIAVVEGKQIRSVYSLGNILFARQRRMGHVR